MKQWCFLKELTATIKIRVSEELKRLIQKIAKNKETPMSTLIEKAILEEIVKFEETGLTETEKKYTELKLKEEKTKPLEYIRSKSAKKIMFLNNIQRQLYFFTQNKKNIVKEDIITNMRSNLDIAKANDWTEEEHKIIEFINSIEAQMYDLNHETKQLEITRVKNDEVLDGEKKTND